MAQSPSLITENVMTAGNMAGSLQTTPFQCSQVIGFSVQAVSTGAPVGTMKLQVSNNNIDYADYPSASTAITSAGTIIYTVSDVYFQWVILVYTFTSGTGVLTVDITRK